MAELDALMKPVPRVAPQVLAKGAPYKISGRGARTDVPFHQPRSHAAAIWPNLAAMEWFEKAVLGLSTNDARKECEQLFETGKALVTNGYLIKSKSRLSFDRYRSQFTVKSALKSPHEFPVTTFAAWAGEVAA